MKNQFRKEEAMEYIIALLGIVIGFVLGYVAHKMRQVGPALMGKILMDRSDDPDEPPYLVVELYDRPEALYGHEQVLFDIAQK